MFKKIIIGIIGFGVVATIYDSLAENARIKDMRRSIKDAENLVNPDEIRRFEQFVQTAAKYFGLSVVRQAFFLEGYSEHDGVYTHLSTGRQISAPTE